MGGYMSGAYISSPQQINAGIVGMVIASYTLDTPASGVTFTGLDLEADKGYYLETYTIASGTSPGNEGIYFNGDTTGSHYYSQHLMGYDTTAAAWKGNSSEVGGMGANTTAMAWYTIQKAASQKTRVSGFYNWISSAAGANSNGRMFSLLHDTNTANVTSITIQASGAGQYQAGSRFVLWCRGN